ncbi:PLP-dependent aminotransferase family protein [Streptomyces sp. JJ36]|uniref:MocR-like pyridoxine biosynthesis transcription factor PdxR n=1 Tax=Streptomyces sp. JJ36 TaxID=2736645 RepID=UPI001F258C9E|nr:PLP-dependent aminotransferase family protein [Streptomyces sp. JJ36]MCF6525144.1 PLP-dependent aminotransferase family protein [Streptomyces sp. JJ36]
MVDSWATSPSGAGQPDPSGPRRPAAARATVGGVDLHLDLEAGRGLRASLMRALRAAVRNGRLSPGTRLPSSRALAADLGIARNTVADAYAELVAEGWLTARQGSGTRVARRAEPPGRPVPGPRREPAGRHRATARPRHDLRSGRPDTSAFPRAAWLTSARRALSTAPHSAFGYADPLGRPELRRALADYLARSRGVRADPDRILIGAGFVDALDTLARVLHGGVAVEAYGLWFHRDILTRAGLSVPPLPLDAHGTRVAALAEAGPRAVLLTPAHQYPTGVPLHPDRRAAVVDWARGRDGLVLEDDYDGEFRYDRRPVGAVQGLDPDRVLYLGTASKSLAPALRLGWTVLPDSLVDPVLAVRAERHHGALDQLTLADFLERGAYDRHVRAMRQRYRRRRDRLVATLAERLPQLRVTGLAAGLHAVLELPPGSEQRVVHAATRRGLAVEGLSRFRHPGAAPGPMDRDALVVGYGAPPEHAWPSTLDALCTTLTEELGRPGG